MPVHFCRLHNRVQAGPAVKTLNSDDQEKHSLPRAGSRPANALSLPQSASDALLVRFQVVFFIYLFSSGPWCPALVRCKASARPPQIRCWSIDPSWFAAKQPRARVKIRMKNKRVGVPQGLRVSLSELLFGWRFVLDSQGASRLDPETKRQLPRISAFFSRRSCSVFSPRRPTMLKLFRAKKKI